MRIFLIPAFLLLCLLALNACKQANNEPVEIEHAWIREAPPAASAMAGYMTIHNRSDHNLILHQAKSPDFKAIEFHRSVEKNGVYKMIPHLHLHIAANHNIELKPGDYHLMMFNPKRQLKAGDSVEVALRFSNDVLYNITVPVKKAQY